MEENVNGISWTYVVEDGQAVIKGRPLCKGMSLLSAISSRSTGAIVIPKTLGGYPVTSIGENAFIECEELTKVSIGEHIRHIGKQAFNGCLGLREITVPDSVVDIGMCAFQYCKCLEKVSIGKSVEIIGGGAFIGCKSLQTFEISPANPLFESRDGVLFSKNMKILIAWPANQKTYAIPEGVTDIADGAFAFSKELETIIIPNSVKRIGAYAFSECTALKQVVFGNGVEEIGRCAFVFCESLRDVVIPDNVKSIGDKAFAYNHALEHVKIGKGLRHIEENAFAVDDEKIMLSFLAQKKDVSFGMFTGCERLQAIELSAGNRRFSSQEGVLFDKERSVLLAYPEDKAGAYSIPEGIKAIAPYAFAGSNRLTEVTIPDSVEEIGEGAFNGCENLLKINVSTGHPRFSSLDGILLDKGGVDLIVFPEGKMDGFPSSEPSPLWEVRDRVRKALSEKEEAFSEWAEIHRVEDRESNARARFPFDDLLQAVPHVTLPDDCRLFAQVTPNGCDSHAIFIGVDKWGRIPISYILCPDGTPESYWEAVVLWFETNQFYRCRHANYGSEELVPDLQRFLREGDTFGGKTGKTILKSLSQKERWQLWNMDFRPELHPVEDGCEVYYTAFAPFSGFIRYCATVRKKDNASMIMATMIERIKYRCPVMF